MTRNGSAPAGLAPGELAGIKAWEARATPGPWERGVAYREAPVNPGPGEWATWRDRDPVEPDLLWQVKHLLVGQCRLCEDGPPVAQATRATRVSLYRCRDTGGGKDYAGEGTRAATYHVHRVAFDRDDPLEPISSAAARRAVLELAAEGGEMRLVLSAADAEFIARARAAVPRLVAEVERLREQVLRLGGRPQAEADPPAAGRTG